MKILDVSAQEKYLGCLLSTENVQYAELRRRLSCAWAVFATYREELCSSRISSAQRIRLFDAVVSPVALYACCTWSLTKEQERLLKTVQRRMLRKMLARQRWHPALAHMEWPEYVQQVTHDVERIYEQHKGRTWVSEYRRRKWKFAGKTARSEDERWTLRVLEWVPGHGLGRSVGRPSTRWCDSIAKFCGGNWVELARDSVLWSSLETGFAESL